MKRRNLSAELLFKSLQLNCLLHYHKIRWWLNYYLGLIMQVYFFGYKTQPAESGPSLVIRKTEQHFLGHASKHTSFCNLDRHRSTSRWLTAKPFEAASSPKSTPFLQIFLVETSKKICIFKSVLLPHNSKQILELSQLWRPLVRVGWTSAQKIESTIFSWRRAYFCTFNLD